LPAEQEAASSILARRTTRVVLNTKQVDLASTCLTASLTQKEKKEGELTRSPPGASLEIGGIDS
jgi:hypothetical protein